MNKDFKAKEIYFEADAFIEAKMLHGEFLSLKDKIISEVKKLLNNGNSNFDQDKLFNEGMAFFYELLKDQYKDKILIDVPGERLAWLIGIDLSQLDQLLSLYNAKKELKAPKREDFATFTTSEEQNERLEIADHLAEYLNNIKKTIDLKTLLIQKGFNNMVLFNDKDQEFKINPYWIKTG